MNNKLTCYIVDDEPLAVKLLESFVSKTPDLELVASFTDSVAAISAIKSHPANLLFLDIQMPDLNGMELARCLPSQTRVIFTTAFKEYAFESYEVNAIDFLLKPIRYNKFLMAVEKARNVFWPVIPENQPHTVEPTLSENSHANGNAEPSITSSTSTLFLRVDGELRNVSTASIMYVSGMKDYVMFYLEGEQRPLITHLTMKAVEAMLPQDKFLRVHRSFIVAVDKITKVDRNDCIYIGREIIHVPEGYLPAFRAFLESRMPK
ncbi:MAG: response regulator transcription factor [Prevotella sp.]|nr:response regulator transcription factor [Prevotella sp.]MBQ4174540.1 response regulator transcription factor [Prevotella sp.]